MILSPAQLAALTGRVRRARTQFQRDAIRQFWTACYSCSRNGQAVLLPALQAVAHCE